MSEPIDAVSGLPEVIDHKNSRNRRLVLALIATRVLNPATSVALDAPTANDTLNEEIGLKRVEAYWIRIAPQSPLKP